MDSWAKYIVFTGSYYIPFLTYFAVTLWLLLRFMQRWGVQESKVTVVLLVGVGSLALPLGGPDWPRLLYALPPVWILLSFALFRSNPTIIERNFPRVTVRANILHAALFFSIAAFLLLSLLLMLDSRVDTLRQASQPVQIAGQTFRLAPGQGSELEELVEEIRSNINDNELFIVAYDPAFYFLLRQENPLFMNQFAPGHLSPSAEKRTVAEIESNPRIRILISREQNPWSSKGLTMHDYAPDLAGYLSTTFEPIEKIGPYVLMRRVER